MITVEFSRSFLKAYGQRVKKNSKLKLQFQKRLDIFKNNRRHPYLHDHKLTGIKANLRSFSITGDIRAIYRTVSENLIVLIDIGSHNQVY